MKMEAFDAALLNAARDGSEIAFARIVDHHQQALRAFLRRMCGDWALADDVAQETFLAAWSRLDRVEEGANLRAWLCGIGYNKCLTALRSARRARAREIGYDAQALRPQGAPAEDRLALEQAMSALPVDQRAVVALCLAADFSHSEAAQALGLPLGTVKSHVARGRERLLQALGADHD
jgi:RNA polymerase sigma-70 factor (ECF subfamily)